MKRLLDDWINGIWEFVVLALGCLLLVACLSGCGTETRTTMKEQTRLTGDVAGLPVNLQAERQQTEESQTTVRGPDLAGIAAPLLPLLPGGGALAGLGGIAFGAWRMLREKAANKALSQTAAGIEDFKAGLQPEIVESLHNSLGRSMDADAKKRVKQVKAQV